MDLPWKGSSKRSNWGQVGMEAGDQVGVTCGWRDRVQGETGGIGGLSGRTQWSIPGINESDLSEGFLQWRVQNPNWPSLVARKGFK